MSKRSWCIVRGCPGWVGSDWPMCDRHWFKVPRETRDLYYAAKGDSKQREAVSSMALKTTFHE